jgi:HK97 gp10 family phage protein
MIQSTMRLSGANEITAALKGVSEKLAGQTLNKAIKAAANVMLRAAKAAARKRHKSGKGTGNLARSMAIRQLTYANGVVYAAIGPSWPKGAHGWLVEHGHRIVTGGTVTRRGGKFGFGGAAPIEKKSRRLQERVYLGRNSRYRDLSKAGATFNRAVGERGHGRTGGSVPAYPFLQPAFDSAKTEMLDAIQQTVEAALA